jgi:FkbM family methyltransferase
MYYRLGARPDGQVRFTVRDVHASFYCRPDPADFRGLEGNFVTEQDFLDALLSTLRPGDTFYDVGANYGLFSIFVGKTVGDRGQVVAFEPDSQTCELLLANERLNQVRSIRLFRKALGEEEKREPLFVGGSLVAQEGNLPERGVAEVVDVVPGDRFVSAEKLTIPRAVKIDVEGFEYSVLRGLAQTLANPACELLCCEVHPGLLPKGVTVDTVKEFVNSLGFSHLRTHRQNFADHVIAYKRTH